MEFYLVVKVKFSSVVGVGESQAKCNGIRKFANVLVVFVLPLFFIDHDLGL